MEPSWEKTAYTNLTVTTGSYIINGEVLGMSSVLAWNIGKLKATLILLTLKMRSNLEFVE